MVLAEIINKLPKHEHVIINEKAIPIGGGYARTKTIVYDEEIGNAISEIKDLYLLTSTVDSISSFVLDDDQGQHSLIQIWITNDARTINNRFNR